jgi:cystathionine beta-synthase
MYDDRWLAQQGLTDVSPETATAGDLLTALGRFGKLISLTPDDTVQRAADTLVEHGFSQIPVMENGRMLGAVHEITIMRTLHQRAAAETRLRDIMARPLPQVDEAVLLEEVYRLLLAGNPAVVVCRGGRMSGIITRTDLMRYYETARGGAQK